MWQKNILIGTVFVFSKENDQYFFLKATCSASKKPTSYCLSLAISKFSKEIVYAFCECPAGSGGLCSHSFALMKLAAKWSIDRLHYIPSETSCTAKPCQWSQRKTLSHVDQKQPLSYIPMKKKNNVKMLGNIASRLYDPRVYKQVDLPRLNIFNKNMLKTPISNIFQSGMQPLVKSKFGDVPVGSPLSYQYPMLINSLNVTCSFNVEQIPTPPIIDYPCFPIHSYSFLPLRDYVDNTDSKTLEVIKKLEIGYVVSENIEKETRLQSASELWHDVRKYRFTASKCYDLHNVKTNKGFISLAKNLISPKEPNPFLLKKFEYGKVNEPVALQMYDNYFRSRNHSIQVSSSGIIILSNAFIIGASPDGKVIDTFENDIFGIVEIKCPEKYSEYNIADIAKVEKNFCLCANNGNITINKQHSYYDQVVMQMALTGTTWCDFVVYSKKGIVIDRVRYDHEHWLILQKKIYDFYFNYYLPSLVEFI